MRYKLQSLKSQALFQGLGDGWALAVINSQVELTFIREAQEQNLDLWSYWIGGSAAADKDTIEYPAEYFTNGSGLSIIVTTLTWV